LFRDDGFVQKIKILPESEMDELRLKFEEIESTKPNQKFTAQEINHHFNHRFLFDLCTHKTVLSTVESLLDSRDIVLLSSTIFTKYPPDETTPEYAGDFVGWHQDLKYWGLESLDPDQQVPIVNMWLAIDKADEENGAMMFIKGSHQEGFFDHVQSTKKGNVLNENQDMIIPERFRDKIVQSELEPGEASFHDGMVIHGSKASLNRRRMGFTAQYTVPGVRMNRMDYTQTIAFSEDFRKPVLVKGNDKYGTLEYFKKT